MINRHPTTKPKIKPRFVASFGRARLVKMGLARYELRNAAAGDLTAAKEWVSLFLHEACIVKEEIPLPHRRGHGQPRRHRAGGMLTVRPFPEN